MKILFLIQKMQGGLRMTAFDEDTSERLWAGHCHPSEKEKTIAEALANLDGSSLHEELHKYLETIHTNFTEQDHEEAWHSQSISAVIKKVRTRPRPNVQIIDRSI